MIAPQNVFTFFLYNGVTDGTYYVEFRGATSTTRSSYSLILARR